jgi:hypothetical protein
MGVQELMNAPVGRRAAHDRQDAEQQHMGQVEQPPLGTAMIRNGQQALFQGGQREPL